ncbi:MAG TPA: SMC-Scp complex subunit ScpB [Actinomycetaceae bacterium]|nr:SMC-Scp complex subunit ScpB [Actinomycetaceae bacterium]
MNDAAGYAEVPDDAIPHEQLGVLEAILMVVDEPVSAQRLAAAVGMPAGQVSELLHALAAEYAGESGGRERGFQLREVAGGWRIYSRPRYADVVGQFVLEGQTARLTQAALETLAIIAYRQPISRGRISAIRGVNVDGVVRTLLTRGLVAEVGKDDDSGAVMLGTTTYFLERMGLTSVDDLPPLAPYLPPREDLPELAGELP